MGKQDFGSLVCGCGAWLDKYGNCGHGERCLVRGRKAAATAPAPTPQAQPALVRVPVEVIAQPSGASSIVYLTRLPCVGETVPLGTRHLRVVHVQHDGAGMLAGRVFVDDSPERE